MHTVNLTLLTSEALPCSVRIARSVRDLTRVAKLRHSAYMRHVPEFAATLEQIEPADVNDSAVVFIAESKCDGRVVGTLRLQTNDDRLLPVEKSVDLGSQLTDCSLAEATRLAVEPGQIGRHARNALFKACYLQSLAWKSDWIVATARRPLDRVYEALMFVDLLGEGRTVALEHVGNIPHRIFGLKVATACDAWAKRGHPLYSYMVHTLHRDIVVDHVRTCSSPRERRPCDWPESDPELVI